MLVLLEYFFLFLCGSQTGNAIQLSHDDRRGGTWWKG
jgi:hypothetical protein